MADEAKFPDIPGASGLFAWFGFWPSFHDGEVLSLHLDRAGPSQLRVHTWEGTPQVDSRGYGVLQKHVVVTFILENISDLELDGFSHQNVLAELTLTELPDGYELKLWPCYGISGEIKARSVRIEFAPSMPPDS
jgi:immunity protein 50 of polymorphic toxin system